MPLSHPVFVIPALSTRQLFEFARASDGLADPQDTKPFGRNTRELSLIEPARAASEPVLPVILTHHFPLKTTETTRSRKGKETLPDVIYQGPLFLDVSCDQIIADNGTHQRGSTHERFTRVFGLVSCRDHGQPRRRELFDRYTIAYSPLFFTLPRVPSVITENCRNESIMFRRNVKDTL